MVVSNMTLVKIASIGGIITVSMGFALRIKLDNDIKRTDYYKEALNTLRSNRAAVHFLGEPIKVGQIDVSDEENNFTRNNKARYEVPVWGPNQKGKMYLWASKKDEKWNVNRIELGLKNEPLKRLLVKSEDMEQ